MTIPSIKRRKIHGRNHWQATDADGVVFAFTKKPRLEQGFGILPEWGPTQKGVICVSLGHGPCPNYATSLRRILPPVRGRR